MSYRIYSPHCEANQQERVVLLVGYLSSLDVHVDTRWYFSVPPRPFDIVPGTDADAFVANVFEYLREKAGIDAHESRGTTYEGILLKAMMVWCVKSDRLLSKFSLVHHDNEVYGFVSGTTDSPDGAHNFG